MFCFCLVGRSVSCIVFQCLSDSVFVVIQGLDSYGLHIRYIRSALVRNKGCILCVAVVACDVKGTSHEKCSPWFLLKMLQMLAEPSYSILSREAEYCDAFVCLCVCLSKSASGTTRPIFTEFLIFVHVYIWPWLSPPLTVLWCFMYFWLWALQNQVSRSRCCLGQTCGGTLAPRCQIWWIGLCSSSNAACHYRYCSDCHNIGNTVSVNSMCWALPVSNASLHAGKLWSGRQKHRYLLRTLAASRKFLETFR